MTTQKSGSLHFATILFLACAGHFTIDFMLGIWPIFKTMVHVDLALAGIMAATCVILGEAMQIFVGSLADRGYQKQLLMTGISLGCFSTLFSYCTGNFAFLILYFFTCMGSAAFHPTAASLLGHLNSKNKSILMGLFSASGMLGLGCSQLCFSWTYKALDGHTAILSIPALALMLFVYSVRCSPKATQDKKESIQLSTFIGYFKNRILRSLYFVLVGNQIVLWTCVFLLPDFLASRNYSEWLVFGGGHLCFMIGATISPPLMGYLADRTHPKAIINVSMWGSLSLLALIIFVPALKPFTPALLLILGAVIGGVAPLVWSIANHLFPESRGSVSAFLMGGVWVVSESLGIGLSGIIASAFSSDGPALAIACMSSSLLIGAVAVSKITGEETSLQTETAIGT